MIVRLAKADDLYEKKKKNVMSDFYFLVFLYKFLYRIIFFSPSFVMKNIYFSLGNVPSNRFFFISNFQSQMDFRELYMMYIIRNVEGKEEGGGVSRHNSLYCL